MWEQLLKRHSLPRHRHDRDIEEPTVRITPTLVPKAEKGKKLGPRTHDPRLPFGVTANQARALDAVVRYGSNVAASQAIGISSASVDDSVQYACKRIPGAHRLAKLIAWAVARGLHKDAAEG
jgi:hypothetical protein